MLGHLYFFIVIFFAGTKFSNAGTFSVDYTNHRFLKDGKPFRYISGEIHYFRVHPDLWNDRLQRIRALGLNAIQVYVPWNLHEAMQGSFDFSGGLNITNFLTLAQQNGLNVLLRPGPYICAEWENGGLPYWLLKYDGIKMRTYDTTYINAVQNYFQKLLHVINPLLYKHGGPILMIQVENEYGSLGACDHTYTAWLRDLIWSYLGNNVVLYTTDNANDPSLNCGQVPNTLTTVDFGPTFDSTIDFNFQLQYEHSMGGPTVCSEFWVNWFITWGQPSPRTLDSSLVIDNLSHMYNKSASFNIYMIHGGTNFGFTNGAEVYGSIITSYDYGAAIAENGDITPTYTAIHSFIGNLTDWVQPPLAIPSNNPVLNYGQVSMKRIGTSLISTITQIQETCTLSSDPLSFEQIDHGYGFVLYTTTLKVSGTTLSAPNIKDYGYVFINNVYQGMLSRDFKTSINLTSAAQGDMLRILVENRGRLNFWFIKYPELDRKGLHSDVNIDFMPIQDWYACGINLTKASIDSLSSSSLTEEQENVLPEKAVSQPGVYIGQFNATQLEDTFFDSTGWGKGQLFVNGYNIGRYWPQNGPQMTLYVPKPYIQPINTVVLLELVGAQQNYANFTDHAIFDYKLYSHDVNVKDRRRRTT